MERNQLCYGSRLKTTLVHFAKVVDAPFKNDILSDIIVEEVLHISPSISNRDSYSGTECDVDLRIAKRALLEHCLDEFSFQCPEDFEMTRSYKQHLMRILIQTLCNGGAATLRGSQYSQVFQETFCEHRSHVVRVRAHFPMGKTGLSSINFF